MTKLTIYGASDDLIEVDGDSGDEFGVSYDTWNYLHFSDGTVLKIGYGRVPDKGWHIEPVTVAEPTRLVQLDPIMEDDGHYTDRVELHGDITDVECWSSPDGPTQDDLEAWFDNNFDSPREYTATQLRNARAALLAVGED